MLTEFQITMILLMVVATVVFIFTVLLMVNPRFRSKFLEYFPTMRGRNGQPFTEKEKIGLGVLIVAIVVIILI